MARRVATRLGSEGQGLDGGGVSAKKRKALMGPGDVRDLPAGLLSRDLMSRGYSYVAAVDYWRQNGQPNQMDVERNGIPCETVYSQA